jgi:hypothetical protein
VEESYAATAQIFLASREISLLALMQGMLWTLCNNGNAICMFVRQKRTAA